MKSHGRRYMKRRKQTAMQWHTKGPECWTVEVSMHNVTGRAAEKVLDTVADVVYTRFKGFDIYVGAAKDCNLDGECRP